MGSFFRIVGQISAIGLLVDIIDPGFHHLIRSEFVGISVCFCHCGRRLAGARWLVLRQGYEVLFWVCTIIQIHSVWLVDGTDVTVFGT